MEPSENDKNNKNKKRRLDAASQKQSKLGEKQGPMAKNTRPTTQREEGLFCSLRVTEK